MNARCQAIHEKANVFYFNNSNNMMQKKTLILIKWCKNIPLERMKINARNATLLFKVVAMQYDPVFSGFWTRRIIENKKRKLVKGSSKVIITLFHVRKVTLEISSWSKTVSLPNTYRLRYGIVLWSQETLA